MSVGLGPISHKGPAESQPDAEGFVTKETAPIVLLGQGGTFFRESVRAIKDIGYEGWIISETFYTRPNLNVNGEDYISLARKDVETLKAAFGEY